MKLRSVRSSKFARGFAALSLVAATSALARPVPLNLTNGLDKIVESSLLQQGAILPPLGTSDPAAYTAAVAKEAATFSRLAIVDPATRNLLVDIMPDGTVPVTALQGFLQSAFPTMRVANKDLSYAGHGILEVYVGVLDAWKIASFKGVSSVVLQLRPVHSVGSVTSQGVNQHRVNRINTMYSTAAVNPTGLNYDGTGMSIGVMSDSYNSQPSMEGGYTTAQADVASGDLPGIAAATPTAPNTKPVVVLEDYNPTPGATNEGRAMCQIVADMAPMARIGFATADTGEVGFANNIRALGGLTGFTKDPTIQQGFKGDVVCDDVSYLDEPMFQDGIVAQGVIDVVNAGVTYCSSASNNAGTDGYASVFRPVPNGTGLTAAAGNAALANTNIDLTGVPTNLYAGGFHNFNPSGALDVAQTINTGSDAGGAVFQWNDPYDVSAPTLGAQIFSGSGTSTNGSAMNFGPFQFTQGQEYVIIEKSTGTLATQNFDGIVDVIDAQGNVIVSQDTGTDETIFFFTPATGQYTVRVRPFTTPNPAGTGPGVPTMGPYSLTVNAASGTARITQDFNLLFFDTNGTFISAVASNNFANNRPIELFVPTFSADGFSQVQMVISRSNTTAPANAANQLRYVFFGNGASGVGPAEYNDYLSPVTYGHSAAAGANSVAAYSMFRPNLPEDFTSPGPVTIYFDTNNNRLATPQVRLKPDLAAADGANNTFFPLGPAQDAPFDADTNFANFYGTSAASPHSAAIAALVIQAHKPAVLTPLQVKTLMQLNTFPHDLDPYESGGSATAANGGTVSVKVVSDNSANTNTGANDPNAWTVSYTGPGFLKRLSFNPEATGPTGGNPTGGNFNGVAPNDDFFNGSNYKYTPGMVFNSTASRFLRGASTGLVAADATPTFTNAAPAPSNTTSTTYFWTLNLAFSSNFTAGKAFRFDVGRAQQQDAQSPQGMTMASVLHGQPNTYSADILGDGVLIPQYADVQNVLPGMTFNGVVSDGTTDYPFTGRIANRVGAGYSPLDGYGFINAQAATAAALPVPGVVSRMTHGAAGIFDIPLPLTGQPAVECRRPGANNGYQLVYTFDRSVATAGNAAMTQGTANVSTPVLGPGANQITINLTGVADAQHLVVTLSNVHDISDTVLAAVAAPVDVLLGDTGANGTVNAADVAQTRAQSGMTATASNYREDVNEDGVVNAADVALVRSRNGNSLAAPATNPAAKRAE